MPQQTCGGQTTSTPLRQRMRTAAAPVSGVLNSTGVV